MAAAMPPHAGLGPASEHRLRLRQRGLAALNASPFLSGARGLHRSADSGIATSLPESCPDLHRRGGSVVREHHGAGMLRAIRRDQHVGPIES
jgi:hypothetical protein